MKHITTFVILVALIILAGISYSLFPRNSSQNAQKAAYSGVVEKIRIGNVREYSIFNSIAKEKGYFSNNGLNAEIKEYEAGPQAIKDLLAGEVDIAFASDNAGVQTIFTNPELRIIAQFVKNRVFSVIARKDKGIARPADLRGKKIGVTKKSAGEYLFSQFLALQNLKQQDLTIVDLPPSQIKIELQKGSIDAAILFEPNVFDLIKILGEKVIVWPIEYGYDTFGLIYTTDTFIQLHPDLTERYLRSLVEAELYYKSHPSEIKELVGKTFGYSKEYIDYSWPKNDHAIALNQEFILSMENLARWAITSKLADKSKVPNYLNYIYFNSLEKVQPESVTIIH